MLSWNESERAKIVPLAAAAVESGDCLLYEAVDQAQRQCLPQDRWRRLESNGQLMDDPSLLAAIDAYRNALKPDKPGRRRKVEADPKLANLPRYHNLHVRWTEDEKGRLAEAAAEMVRDGRNVRDALRLAQEEVLPMGRRRDIRYDQHVPEPLRKSIETLAALPPRAPSLGWRATPVKELATEAAPEEPISIEKRLKDLDMRLDSLEFTAMKILDLLESRQPQQVIAGTAPILHKKKVILSGYLKIEFEAVERTWGEFFSLSFVHPDHGTAVSDDRLKSADYVIVCTKQPHGCVHRIRNFVPRSRTMLVPTAVVGGCKALETIFASLQKSAVPAVQH